MIGQISVFLGKARQFFNGIYIFCEFILYNLNLLYRDGMF